MLMTLRLADHDYLSTPADMPANTRWEGLIDPAGVTLISAVSAWYLGGNQPQQASVATVRLLDADGLLDAAALDDLAGAPVSIQQVDQDAAYSTAITLARLVVDKLEVVDDGVKQLSLRDAHNDLDEIINPGVFADSVDGLAGQAQPMIFGAVSNAPVLLTGSDGSVGWIADRPVDIATLRDRGDPMEVGTFTRDAHDQQVLLVSPPIGPMTADVSSIGLSGGEPIPATLAQSLREIFRRLNKTSISLDGANAIDTATGYAGVGYYAADPRDARVALRAVLDSYGAWLYQRDDGVIEVARLDAPEAFGGTLAFDLTGDDLTGDLTFTNDAAPNLRRRMAYRPNARIMRESDFVTDLIDVPPSLRTALGQPYAGVVTASGSLPAEYAHADNAEPFISLFWREEDAQAEVNRIVGLYGGTVRRTYKARVTGDVTFNPKPGQFGRITYPRYGLELGRKVQVMRVERNPATGDVVMYLWGA